MATVVAVLARDRGGPKLVHQLLVYPVVDAPQENGEFTHESYKGDLP